MTTHEDVTIENPTSKPQRAPTAPSVRYHYLDNLRALALLAGILFHVGLGFSEMFAGLWPSANAATSDLFDYWTSILHTFRMPLFFLIAGFFAHYLVQKRGPGGFMKNRSLRITLPFIIFWPLLAAAMLGLFIYAATNMDVDTPIIQMIRYSISNPEAMAEESAPLSTTHLWFIYYLTIFCFATAAVAKWVPKWERFYQCLSNPWVLVLGLPAITTLAMARIFIPFPAPESFVPAPWALAFFGSFFTVGWVFFSRRDMLPRIASAWPYLAASSAVASVVLILSLPEPITLEAVAQFQQAQALTMDQLLRVTATAVLAWHMTLLCLVAGKRFFDRKNAVLRYIADGSYWVYIIHMPVVFYLQFVFHSIDLPLWLEFLVITAITLSVGYISYAVLVRHTPIGWLLNGRRKKESSKTAHVASDTAAV